jgi:hypothetical protein
VWAPSGRAAADSRTADRARSLAALEAAFW